MAKIMIAGDAVVVTSALKLKDIETVEKYRAEKLVLMGGEDGKEPVFAVGTGNMGALSKYGATFNSEDANGYATITELIVGQPADRKAFVAEKVGVAIINLNKLEETIPAVLEEIAAEKAAVMASIELYGSDSCECSGECCGE